MTDQQINRIVTRLDRIDERMLRLETNAVTWKTLLAALATVTAIVTAVVTIGNQLWGT